MEAANTATQILAYPGVYKAFGLRRQHRYATPEREKHGKRAGTYGRGLRNWINRAQAAKQANRPRTNHV